MEKIRRAGSVMLEDGKITVTAVSKIIQNNSRLISVLQGENTLTVTGDDFNVTEINLETGRLAATGTVKELKFSSSHEKQDFLKKLFK